MSSLHKAAAVVEVAVLGAAARGGDQQQELCGVVEDGGGVAWLVNFCRGSRRGLVGAIARGGNGGGVKSWEWQARVSLQL